MFGMFYVDYRLSLKHWILINIIILITSPDFVTFLLRINTFLDNQALARIFR